MLRRLCKAGGAYLVQVLHRYVAKCAALAGQEIKAAPASRANLIIGHDDCPTSRASWRKGKVQDWANEAHPLLSLRKDAGTSPAMSATEIFDRTARRRALFASQRADPDDRWLLARMTEEILFRLDAVTRPFSKVLLMGSHATALADVMRDRGISGAVAAIRPVDSCFPVVVCDEDRLAVVDSSCDLVLAAGGLETVNDLPGALILIRRALKPGGLFMGAMAGAGSLSELRPILVGDGSVLRTHPQIDVRAAGDLLARTGFVLPVADADTIDVSYSSLKRLFADLRANALGNCLANRVGLNRADLANIQQRFEAAHNDQMRFAEQFSLIYLTGWAPEA